MDTLPDTRLDRYVPLAQRCFIVALAVWVAASVILAVPHGAGHSIESLRLFDVAQAIAFPIWVASVALIATSLAIRTWRMLGGRSA